MLPSSFIYTCKIEMQIIYKMQIVLIVVIIYAIVFAFFKGLLPPSNQKMVIHVEISMHTFLLSLY